MWLAVMPLLVAGVASAHVPSAAASISGAASGAGATWIAVLLSIAVLLYAIGLARLWPRLRERRPYVRRALAFTLGMTALVALLLGSLDSLAATSFAAHMVQHEGLMLIAAPLLVLGHGLPVMLWAFPRAARLGLARATHAPGMRAPWQVLSAPLTAWLLHAVALWAWHAPALFNAALRDPAVHDWQHASFLGTALLFWHALLARNARRAHGTSVLYLFTTTVHTGVLGALITFAGTPLYAPLDRGLVALPGLTALEDQQLGGLIMWVPGALVYVAIGLWLMGRWIGAADDATLKLSGPGPGAGSKPAAAPARP